MNISPTLTSILQNVDFVPGFPGPADEKQIPALLPPGDLFSDLAESFRQATGLPLHWHPPGEFCVPDDEGIPDFCRVMSAGHKACATCVKTHLALQDTAGLKSARCFAGLTSSAVPVVREGEALGFLHTGHVYVDRPAGCATPGRGCMLPGRARRKCACAGACQETRAFSSRQYEGALGLLRVFSNQLAALPEMTPTASRHSSIDLAVRLIRSDVARDWRLGNLASAVGMHHGYFSEQFHARTGQTLTKFLAQLRVQKARQLLRFTGYPVSDIAFASGFRSISQFNRVFKAHTGHAPKDERAANSTP